MWAVFVAPTGSTRSTRGDASPDPVLDEQIDATGVADGQHRRMHPSRDREPRAAQSHDERRRRSRRAPSPAPMMNSSRMPNTRPITSAATARRRSSNPGEWASTSGLEHAPTGTGTSASSSRTASSADERALLPALSSEPVGQHRDRHRLDVVGRGVVAALRRGVGPRRRRRAAAWHAATGRARSPVAAARLGDVDEVRLQRAREVHRRGRLAIIDITSAAVTTGLQLAQRLASTPCPSRIAISAVRPG